MALLDEVVDEVVRERTGPRAPRGDMLDEVVDEVVRQRSGRPAPERTGLFSRAASSAGEMLSHVFGRPPDLAEEGVALGDIAAEALAPGQAPPRRSGSGVTGTWDPETTAAEAGVSPSELVAAIPATLPGPSVRPGVAAAVAPPPAIAPVLSQIEMRRQAPGAAVEGIAAPKIPLPRDVVKGRLLPWNATDAEYARHVAEDRLAALSGPDDAMTRRLPQRSTTMGPSGPDMQVEAARRIARPLPEETFQESIGSLRGLEASRRALNERTVSLNADLAELDRLRGAIEQAPTQALIDAFRAKLATVKPAHEAMAKEAAAISNDAQRAFEAARRSGNRAGIAQAGGLYEWGVSTVQALASLGGSVGTGIQFAASLPGLAGQASTEIGRAQTFPIPGLVKPRPETPVEEMQRGSLEAREAETIAAKDSTEAWVRSRGEIISRYWDEVAKQFPSAYEGRHVVDEPSLLLDPIYLGKGVIQASISMAPSLIMAGGVIRGIQIGGRVLKLTDQLILDLARVGAAVSGGIGGGGLEGAQTYEEIRRRGGSHDQAAKGAILMGLAATGLNTLSFTKMFGRPGAGPFGRVKHVVGAGFTEAGTEAFEEPSEALILGDNMLKALKEEGVDVAVPSFITGGFGAALAGRRAGGREGVRGQRPDIGPPSPIDPRLLALEAFLRQNDPGLTRGQTPEEIQESGRQAALKALERERPQFVPAPETAAAPQAPPAEAAATAPAVEPAPSPVPAPAGAPRPAPVEWLGWQPGTGRIPAFPMWTLTEDIPGHPKGSTVGATALREAGYEAPEPSEAAPEPTPAPPVAPAPEGPAEGEEEAPKASPEWVTNYLAPDAVDVVRGAITAPDGSFVPAAADRVDKWIRYAEEAKAAAPDLADQIDARVAELQVLLGEVRHEARRIELAGKKAEGPIPIATGTAFSASLYQGRGKTREQIFGRPDGVSILGPAQYYAFMRRDAARYGDTTEHQVELSNPLVILSDREWFDLLWAANARQLSSVDRVEGSREDAARRLQDFIVGKGHDGLITRFPPADQADVGETGQNIKRLRESFQHSTVVKFAAPSAPTTTIAPPKVEPPPVKPPEPPQPPPGTPAAFTLPRDLAGGKPRFGYGSDNYTLDFESDLDKALFTVAQTFKNKRDADYMAALRTVYPDSEEQAIRDLGRAVKDRVKLLVKGQDATQPARVPAIMRVPAAKAAPAPVPPTVVPKVEGAGRAGGAAASAAGGEGEPGAREGGAAARGPARDLARGSAPDTEADLLRRYRQTAANPIRIPGVVVPFIDTSLAGQPESLARLAETPHMRAVVDALDVGMRILSTDLASIDTRYGGVRLAAIDLQNDILGLNAPSPEGHGEIAVAPFAHAAYTSRRTGESDARYAERLSREMTETLVHELAHETNRTHGVVFQELVDRLSERATHRDTVVGILHGVFSEGDYAYLKAFVRDAERAPNRSSLAGEGEAPGRKGPTGPNALPRRLPGGPGAGERAVGAPEGERRGLRSEAALGRGGGVVPGAERAAGEPGRGELPAAELGGGGPDVARRRFTSGRGPSQQALPGAETEVGRPGEAAQLPLGGAPEASPPRAGRPVWADEFEAVGGKIDPDGTVVLYHATTADNAARIVENGVLRRPVDAPDSYGVYLSSSRDVGRDYGDGTVIPVRVRVADLHLDDAFPGRRLDFTIPTRRGEYRPVAVGDAAVQTLRTERTAVGDQGLIPGTPGRAIPIGKITPEEPQRPIEETPLFGQEAEARRRASDEAQGRLFEPTTPYSAVPGRPELVGPAETFKHGEREPVDEAFYYHVTTAAAARRIIREGFVPGRRQTMAEGAYRDLARGKVFLTDRQGVAYWRDRIEEHLEHQYDNPPKLVVVRVSRDAVSVESDPNRAWNEPASWVIVGEPRRVEESTTPYSALPRPRFYSALLRAVEAKVSARASADQILATVRAVPGVKAEEIKDTGLEDWLRTQGDRPITRAEVLEYLRANEVRVEIKKLGSVSEQEYEQARANSRETIRAFQSAVRDAGIADVDALTDKAYNADTADERAAVAVDMPQSVRESARRMWEAQDRRAEIRGRSEVRFGPDKHPTLSLPGAIDGTYVELLVKVPNDAERVRVEDVIARYLTLDESDGTYAYLVTKAGEDRFGWDEGEPVAGYTTSAEAARAEAIAAVERHLGSVVGVYTEPHFNEPVVFHVRAAEHLDEQRRRGFFIEEVQSQLQQEARALREKEAKRGPLSEEDRTRLAMLESFPFAKSWHERAFKEALDYALRLPPDAQGRRIEWIGWTPGQVQVDRYDLSKQADSLHYIKDVDGTYRVTAWKNERVLLERTDLREDALEGLVGKNIADKIIDNVGQDRSDEYAGVEFAGALTNLDLKIGGEWAYNLYDRTLPNFVRGYVKKWGAGVGQGRVQTTKPGEELPYRPNLVGQPKWASEEGAWQPIHHVSITDAMRRAVLEEGQAAFEPTTRYARRSDATEADDRGAQQAFDFLDQVASRPVSSLRGDVLGRGPTGVPRTLGVAFDVAQINKELRETGTVNFRGRVIDSPEAYALAAQILRNPLFETARFHFTDDAGRVVYQESYTSRLPNSVEVFVTRDMVGEVQAMWARAQAQGATKTWVTHNHPTGAPKPSDADVDLTTLLAEHMPLQGHVVTDGKQYGFIEPDGTTSLRDVPGVTEDLLLRPAVPHRLLRRKIENAEDLAALGRELSTPEGWAGAFHVGADGRIRGIQELPIADLVDLDKAVPYLKESRAGFGAVETMLWTTTRDPRLAWNGQFLVRQGAIADYGWTGGTAVVELLGQPGTAAMLEEAAKLRERPGPAIRVEEPTRRYEPLDALDGDLRSIETWVTNAAPRSRIAVGPVVWYRTTNAAFPWRHQAEQISTAGLLARIQAARAAAQAKTLLPAASHADDATRQNTEAVRLDQARARADRRTGVPPVPPITPTPATDAAVEAALSTTAVHGLPAIRERLVEAYHMARRATTFEYDLRGFPLDRDEIRIFHGARRRALWGAKGDVAGVVGRLANLDELRHLGRIVWLRDWLSRSTLVDTLADGSTTPRYPGGLPFGLTPAQVEPELQRLLAAANDRINAAVEAHDRLMEAERADLEARGLLDEERGIPNYAPHFVLEHQPEPGPRQPGTGQRIREPFRGFLRRTVGSEKAIETNYIRAMFQHRTEVRFADATDDFALTVLQRHDRADRLDPAVRKRLKPGQVVSSLSLVDAQGRPIPGATRYKAIQYRPGRQIFPASTIPERAIAQAIANSEKSFEIEVARVRHVGALGRYFRIYVVPEAIANRFEHWGAKETEDGLRLLNNATNRWKALTIGFWGQAGNVLNLLGDVTNLSRTPAALLQLPGAAVEAARWKWGKGTDLTRLMEQYDALSAGYVTGELYFEARMPEFRQFLTHAEQAKQRAMDVARFYFRDIPEFREAAPRIAMARHQLRRLAKGKSLQAGRIPIAGLTGVRGAMHLARRFTVDYQWFTPEENRYLRGFLLPFYSWARQNTPNWLRFLWLSKIGLASFLGLRMMLEMWNNGDDDRRTVEQSLQSYERNSAHLVTGWKDKDGKMIVVFWAGDPAADALGMVGLAGTPARLSDLATERITLSQAAREQLRAFATEPGQRAANLLTPLVKIPGEIITGKSTLTGGDITPKSMQGTREDFWRRGRHAAESLIRPLREERQFEIASGKKGFDWLTYRYGLGLPFKRIDVEEAEMRVSTDLWYEARAEAVQEALDDARKSVDFAKLAPHQQEVELRDAADKALKTFEKATKRPVTKKRWRELEYAK